MALSLDQIVEEAAQLPEDVVAELIERIVVSRYGGIEPGVESAWQAETRRRVTEIIEGRTTGIPLQESLTRAARILER